MQSIKIKKHFQDDVVMCIEIGFTSIDIYSSLHMYLKNDEIQELKDGLENIISDTTQELLWIAGNKSSSYYMEIKATNNADEENKDNIIL